MQTKALLIDFDGTVVTRDILTLVCGIVGKEAESEQLNEEYMRGIKPGITPLITRINFLAGITLQQITAKLKQRDYLMPGAAALIDYCNQHEIISILNSGNIIPILQYYQHKLGITHIVGTQPEMKNETIVSISEADFSGADFKLEDSKKILASYHITAEETVAIGDSIADKTLFDYAATSIAINPRPEIRHATDYVIYDDLAKAIPILQTLSQK